MSSRDRRRRSRSRSPFQRRQRREDGKPSRSEAGKSFQRHKSGGRESGSQEENGDHRLDRRHDNSLNPERIRRQEHGERSNRKRDVGYSRARQRYRMEGAEREPVELNHQTGQGTNNERIPDKDGPNYNLSGKLTEYTNTYKGVVIKYNEPPEARVPKTRWRIYPFKGEEALSVMYIHRQSAYLLGRQRHIVDIAIDHPSCSKQHAVLQYRLVDYHKPDGSTGRKVKPYIIDLDSINGTYLNNQRVDPRRFYELKEKDVLKFGFSTREYVILTEKSQESERSGANADEDETTP